MSAHPILIEIAEQFATEQLIIRSPLWGDGAMVNAAIIESIEELRPWMPWAQQPPTVEQSEESVRLARIKFLERADMRLHVFHKETGEFIGASGLHRIDWMVKKFEIGYWIRTSQSGKGLMTEAVEGVMDFVIKQLSANRLEIRCDANNIRSMRIAERLGFRLEGILRSDTLDVTGNLRDTMVFAKVRGQEF